MRKRIMLCVCLCAAVNLCAPAAAEYEYTPSRTDPGVMEMRRPRSGGARPAATARAAVDRGPVLRPGFTAATDAGRLQPAPGRALYPALRGFHYRVDAALFRHAYEEPDLMEQSGWLLGARGTVTYRDGYMLRGSLRGAYGEVDYTSNGTGTMDGVPQYLVELRAASGPDFSPRPDVVVTPYIGWGYRRLFDDAGGMTTTTGNWGYDRIANYYFSPVGVELNSRLQAGWRLRAAVEYEYFWGGEQESLLATTGLGLADVTNKQEDGYGIRGEVTVTATSGRYDYFFKGHIEYWDIKDSSVSIVYQGGLPVAAFREPANTTMEAGIAAGLEF